MARGPLSKPSWVLYYDGQCRLCLGIVRLLRLLDVTGAAQHQPYQGLKAPPKGLTRQDLQQAAYLATAGGELYEGFYALRKLALRMPALLPLGLLLWIPGVNLLGSAAYRRIANNRHRFGGCQRLNLETPSCEVGQN